MTYISEIYFSDVYVMPDRHMYVHDRVSRYGLAELEVEDWEEFQHTLFSGFKGKSSYSIIYSGSFYRVERVETINGVLYTARRMPKTVPDIRQLGFQKEMVNHMLSLSKASGLLLWAGATGSGKTTSISALLRYYLESEGGFAYTIEDPPELPLDGLYKSTKSTGAGGIGICKQTEPIDENWGMALKQALRSRPKYILVGEIRTPETASQVLRASISGHLVLSTIHGNSVDDAIKSLIKYAIAAGLDEQLAADLLSRGVLGVISQRLMGVDKFFPEVRFAFANPDINVADPLRAQLREKDIYISTLIEMQMIRMLQNKPLFERPETTRK